MTKLGKISSLVVLVSALLLPCLAQQAGAHTTGYNADLDNSGGVIYFPLQQSTSGDLGDLIGGGPQRVGMVDDKVSLTGLPPAVGSTSSGYVSFMLVFDYSADVDPSKPLLDPVETILLLKFFDLDLHPDNMFNANRALYSETLGMTFYKDVADAPASLPPGYVHTLTLDDTNHYIYSGTPDYDPLKPPTDPNNKLHLTNDVDRTYTVKLTDIGGTPADFADMDVDHEFAMWITVATKAKHLRSTRDTLTNGRENVSSTFVLVGTPIPEPATLGLLVLGGGMVLLRSWRRTAC